MTINKELEAKILRYHHVEKWKVGTISRQLGVHHDVVDRVLSQAGLPKVERSERPTMIDPYLPFILETLKQYPTLTASCLYRMVQGRGYGGGPDHFRHQVAGLRPRPQPEAFQRLKTLPGEQSQIDWGHFGHITIGRAQHKLSVETASYCPQCKSPKLPHRACPKCGTYKGREIVPLDVESSSGK